MKKYVKNFLSGILAVMLAFSLCPTVLALDRQPDGDGSEKNRVTFSHVSQFAAGESAQYSLTEADGTEILIGITKMPVYSRAGGETWRVWYKAIGIDVKFYMTVSNNRVTSVYDYSISLAGASYDDAELTKTSTYGKLTYTYKLPAGLAAYTCWLKGTVTGENDEIDVTWQM